MPQLSLSHPCGGTRVRPETRLDCAACAATKRRNIATTQITYKDGCLHPTRVSHYFFPPSYLHTVQRTEAWADLALFSFSCVGFALAQHRHQTSIPAAARCTYHQHSATPLGLRPLAAAPYHTFTIFTAPTRPTRSPHQHTRTSAHIVHTPPPQRVTDAND